MMDESDEDDADIVACEQSQSDEPNPEQNGRIFQSLQKDIRHMRSEMKAMNARIADMERRILKKLGDDPS